MGLFFGGAGFIIAMACIVLGIKTGKAYLPMPLSIDDLLLPITIDRNTNPGGFMACILVYGLAAIAAIAIAVISVLSSNAS